MRWKKADPKGVDDQLELIMLRDRLDSQQRVGVAQNLLAGLLSSAQLDPVMFLCQCFSA